MNTAELDTMAHRLAYSTARSDIECICMMEAFDANGHWYNTATVEDGDDAEFVANAVMYLEGRGKIERHKGNANIVRILDDSEENKTEVGFAETAEQVVELGRWPFDKAPLTDAESDAVLNGDWPLHRAGIKVAA